MAAQEPTELKRALARFRGAFLAVSGFSLVLNGAMLLVPLYMLQVYDRVLTSRSLETLMLLTLVVVGLLVLSAILDSLRARVMVRVGAALDELMAERLFRASHDRRLRRGAGDAQAVRDMDSLRTFLTGRGLIAFFDAPWSPLFLLLVAAMHPWLGAVAAVGAVVLLALTLLGEALTGADLAAGGRANMAAQALAEEGLRNAEATEAMGMAPHLFRRFSVARQAALAHQAKASDGAGAVAAAAKTGRQILQVGLLGTGAYLAVTQQITPGVMIAASIIAARALAPVEAAIGGWRGFVTARQARARLEALLADQDRPPETLDLPPPTGALAVEKLIVVPPGADKPVLRNIEFTLQPGQALAVIGAVASGKSTLARALVGVWRPWSGHVRLDGAEVGDWDHRALGPHLGYLPETVELFAATVAENIARMGPPEPEAVVAAARLAGIHDMILRLPDGYDTPVGSGGAALSAGQRQRIGLARALYGRPALVVLDEPNANLDLEGEAHLRRAIETVKADGRTVVVVSHRPSVMAAVDLVLVLKDGRQALFGPKEDILPRISKAPAAAPTANAPATPGQGAA